MYAGALGYVLKARDAQDLVAAHSVVTEWRAFRLPRSGKWRGVIGSCEY
jgi:hypothetical protein